MSSLVLNTQTKIKLTKQSMLSVLHTVAMCTVFKGWLAALKLTTKVIFKFHFILYKMAIMSSPGSVPAVFYAYLCTRFRC